MKLVINSHLNWEFVICSYKNFFIDNFEKIQVGCDF